MAPKKAIFSIVKSLSINKPKTAVPKAVEKTMNAVVRAFMLPIYFTPYISAQVEEPRIFAKPFETPIKPRKIALPNETNDAKKNNSSIFILLVGE